MRLNKVDLPAPFFPRMQKVIGFSMIRLISLRQKPEGNVL
jgi:hypothetical protein